MKKEGLAIFIFMFLLINISLINAQPPLEQGANNFAEGFEVEFTKLDIFKVNQTHLFNVHVFNISNGVQIRNLTTVCSFHLFNSSGHHLIDQFNMTFNQFGLDWELEVAGGNFSYVGEFSYLVNCQDPINSLGGLISIGFETTKNGTKLSIAQTIIYAISFVASNILFFLTLYFIFVLPWKNRRENDKIISISKVKYIKLGLIPLCYAFFVWMLNILIVISGLLGEKIISGYFEFMFSLMINLSWPLLIFWTAIFIFVAKNDSKLLKKLKRGILPRG